MAAVQSPYYSLWNGPVDRNENLAETREKFQSHFVGHEATEHGKQWDGLWKEEFVPWDKGTPCPALVDLLASGKIPLSVPGQPRKKALVPGCGRGYDVLLLSAFGYDAYGLDISETALEKARAATSVLVHVPQGMEVYKIRDPAVGQGDRKFINGDFFKSDFLKDVSTDEKWDGKFDLLYDYRFGAALPPILRKDWALRLSQLLSSTGHLICVEFPSMKPETAGGPPWAFPSKIHMAHLSRPGADLAYAYENGHQVLVESKLKPAGSDALIRVMYYKPERTHDIGYDEEGNVTDHVSVWMRPENASA